MSEFIAVANIRENFVFAKFARVQWRENKVLAKKSYIRIIVNMLKQFESREKSHANNYTQNDSPAKIMFTRNKCYTAYPAGIGSWKDVVLTLDLGRDVGNQNPTSNRRPIRRQENFHFQPFCIVNPTSGSDVSATSNGRQMSAGQSCSEYFKRPKKKKTKKESSVVRATRTRIFRSEVQSFPHWAIRRLRFYML